MVEEIEEENHESDPNKYTPMMYDEMDNLIFNATKMVRVGSMDDVFIIEKVDVKEVEAVLFIHSCIPKIKEFSFNLQYNTSTMSSPYLKTFEELLRGLVFFVIETDSKDPFSCDGSPIVQNQKFLREIKIIDLLIDIIIIPFEGENPMYKLEDLTQRSPMTRICQLIYRLLKHCVKDNEFNKFYVAQWISHFFLQSMTTTDKNNLMAEFTISEILQNNKQLLDKQINPTVIENIVITCYNSQKNARFLNLLAALCICGDDAIGSNQDDICDLLLGGGDDEEDEGGEAEGEGEDEEKTDYSNLLIKVETEVDGTNRRHYAIFHEPEYEDGLKVEIENLKTFFTEQNDIRLYNYFESMTYLISLMCLNRNYAGINDLEGIYPIDFCIDSFLNEKCPKILRANMGKICISLHIDKDPLEEINLPILTRVWQEIAQAKTTLPQSRGQINIKLLKLKDFAVEFLEACNGIQRSFTTEHNILTLEVLKIIEKMIILGFYTNETELLKVIMPMIQLLDGSNDFTSQDEENQYNIFIEKMKVHNEK